MLKNIADLFQVRAVTHWRFQRLTAVLLIPTSFWLLLLLQKSLHSPYAETVAWLSLPYNAFIVLVWLLTSLYHAALGLEVVLQDYVSNESTRELGIAAVKLFFLLLAIAAFLAIIFIIIK